MIKLSLPLLFLPSNAMWPNPSDPTRSQESGKSWASPRGWLWLAVQKFWRLPAQRGAR